MKKLLQTTIQFLLVGLLSACSLAQPSDNEAKTLMSLQQVDDYPLYTLRYYGDYTVPSRPAAEKTSSAPGWGCSLFTVLLDEEHLLYGRNFDWLFSPAVLLFMDPPDGYASVSMVDIAYLRFSAEETSKLMELPLEERQGLLDAPSMPFDGMNEHGLAIGMAAVDPGNMQPDPSKPTIGSLGVIREVLDHARDVGEALEVFHEYNIDFTGGPPLHYLIADATGKAVLVEFYQGEMHVIANEQPWHFATNFLHSSVEDPAEAGCWRYDRIDTRLGETQGLIDPNAALDLLADVAQDSTQWSVVYDMGHGEVSVVMGREYANVQTFRIADYFDPR